MWVSKRTWDNLQIKMSYINGQVRDISKFLGIAFYSDIAEEKEKINELRVAAGLLRRAAELLEEAATHQEKN